MSAPDARCVGVVVRKFTHCTGVAKEESYCFMPYVTELR